MAPGCAVAVVDDGGVDEGGEECESGWLVSFS